MKTVNEIFEAYYNLPSHILYWLTKGWNKDTQKEHGHICKYPDCILREAAPQ